MEEMALLPLHNDFLTIFLHGVKETNSRHKTFRKLNHWAVAFFGVPLLAVFQDLSVFVDDIRLTAGMLEGRDAIHSHLSGSPGLRNGPM